jgi:hypothetical protein
MNLVVCSRLYYQAGILFIVIAGAGLPVSKVEVFKRPENVF